MRLIRQGKRSFCYIELEGSKFDVTTRGFHFEANQKPFTFEGTFQELTSLFDEVVSIEVQLLSEVKDNEQ